ncbi:MAG: hypothetical protein HY324_02370, partial [Chlamydiia bacterium]|nr:hypothetical protein [Chlamydiia bacterium]
MSVNPSTQNRGSQGEWQVEGGMPCKLGSILISGERRGVINREVGKGAKKVVLGAEFADVGAVILALAMNKSRDNQEVAHEIKVLSGLGPHPHPNIEMPLGSITVGTSLGLIYPNYVPHARDLLDVVNDNLEDFFFESHSGVQPSPKWLKQIPELLQQLLGALHYLHETCKVTHGDVKPENILAIEISG